MDKNMMRSILNKAKGPMPKVEVEIEEEGMDMNEDFSMIAEEILMAIESKDPEALAEALKAFVQSC